MSGHSRWVHTETQGRDPEGTITYVEGYILALEDVLRDLDDKVHGDGCIALEQAMDAVKESLRQAKHTLEVLTK